MSEALQRRAIADDKPLWIHLIEQLELPQSMAVAQ